MLFALSAKMLAPLANNFTWTQFISRKTKSYYIGKNMSEMRKCLKICLN